MKKRFSEEQIIGVLKEGASALPQSNGHLDCYQQDRIKAGQWTSALTAWRTVGGFGA
nr:hypothetical protein [Pandoraea fibrosis]